MSDSSILMCPLFFSVSLNFPCRLWRRDCPPPDVAQSYLPRYFGRTMSAQRKVRVLYSFSPGIIKTLFARLCGLFLCNFLRVVPALGASHLFAQRSVPPRWLTDQSGSVTFAAKRICRSTFSADTSNVEYNACVSPAERHNYIGCARKRERVPIRLLLCVSLKLFRTLSVALVVWGHGMGKIS